MSSTSKRTFGKASGARLSPLSGRQSGGSARSLEHRVARSRPDNFPIIGFRIGYVRRSPVEEIGVGRLLRHPGARISKDVNHCIYVFGLLDVDDDAGLNSIVKSAWRHPSIFGKLLDGKQSEQQPAQPEDDKLFRVESQRQPSRR
jgi:hypothetical protein